MNMFPDGLTTPRKNSMGEEVGESKLYDTKEAAETDLAKEQGIQEYSEHAKEKIAKFKEESRTPVDSNFSLVGYYDTAGATEKDEHERGNKAPERKFKADLIKFSKALASELEREHDADKKGKKEYARVNIAPIGGDGHIILWKPNSDTGIYISVPVDRVDDENLKIGGRTYDIMYRLNTRKDKYSGGANEFTDINVSVKEMADLIKKEISFQEEGSAVEKVLDMRVTSRVSMIWQRANEDERYGMQFTLFPMWISTEFNPSRTEILQLAQMSSEYTPSEKLQEARDVAEKVKEKWYDSPKIQEARRQTYAMPETILSENVDSPERQALRDRLVKEGYGNGALKKEKHIDIVIGGPGTRKTSMVALPLVEKYGAILIDDDIQKRKMPEFNNGIGAHAVHRETSELITTRIMDKATEAGDNIVFTQLGRNRQALEEIIDYLSGIGYSVDIHLAVLPLDKAIKGVVDRFLSGDQGFLDPAYVEKVSLTPEENYGIVKLRKGVNSYEKLSTDVENGGRPVVLEGSGVRGISGQVRGPDGEYIKATEGKGQASTESAEAGGLENAETSETAAGSEGRRRQGRRSIQSSVEHERVLQHNKSGSEHVDGRSRDAVAPRETEEERDTESGNYRITPSDEVGIGGPKEKYRNNILAIKILKKIEAEGRRATPEEQRALVKYVGWGSMSKAFDDYDHKGWDKEYDELKKLLTPCSPHAWG